MTLNFSENSADVLASEREFWGDCANTFGEEAKQLVYASRIGLEAENIAGRYPVFDVEGKSVLDVGGGPTSMLLRTANLGFGVVLDPLLFPAWVLERYAVAGVNVVREFAEDFDVESWEPFDEVWVYNVLTHVADPRRVCEVVRAAGPTIRVFEWVGIPEHRGHPSELSAAALAEYLGGFLLEEEIVWPESVAGIANLYAGTAAYGVIG